MSVTVTVVWADEPHSVTLRDDHWERVLAGFPLVVAGPGYVYDGIRFQDEWCFAGGLAGTLEVLYDDGGVGWTGPLDEADIATDE